jgi:hypothetical protein
VCLDDASRHAGHLSAETGTPSLPQRRGDSHLPALGPALPGREYGVNAHDLSTYLRRRLVAKVLLLNAGPEMTKPVVDHQALRRAHRFLISL